MLVCLEELDHFNIGEDVPELEVAAEEINVMEFMEPDTRVRAARRRRNSSR